MSSEIWDPVVELQVKGIGFDGEDWGDLRGQGTIRVSPEAVSENRELIEALRVVAVKRLDALLASLAVTRSGLDFSLPNQPLGDDVFPLVGISSACNEVASVLYALAPTRYDDEDGGGDDEPDPGPTEPEVVRQEADA